MSSSNVGPAQQPSDFDRTRINPEIREALKDHSPEVQQRVKAIADAPPSEAPPRWF